MSNLTSHQALSAAMLLAEQKFPYFITGLASLARRPAPGLGTFGVTKGMVLLYDPEVLDKWTCEETAGVIVHELLHVLRNHAQRCMVLVADPKVWNFAADCVAARTQITMADGSTKRIDQIRAGDSIVGVQGGKLVRGIVLRTLAKLRGGETSFVFDSQGDMLYSTKDHRILTPKGYIHVNEELSKEAPSAQVYRVRKGIHLGQLQAEDGRRDGRRTESALSERAIVHAGERNLPAQKHRQEAERTSNGKAARTGAGVFSRDRRWRRNDYSSQALQQEVEQDLLSTSSYGVQYQHAASELATSARILFNSINQHGRETMLEDVSRRARCFSCLPSDASLSGDQGTASRAGDGFRQAPFGASVQNEANPADAPDISGSSPFELAVCKTQRVCIPTGEIYYDLVTTCHSFIAEGFAVHNCEINDDLEDRIALPARHLLPKLFGFDNGKLAEEYYTLLQQKAQQQQQKQQSKSDQGEEESEDSDDGEGEDSDDEGEEDGSGGNGDGEQEQSSDSSGSGKSDSDSGSGSGEGSGEIDKPAAGAGWCGSGAGRPVPGEPEETDKANRPQTEVEQIQRDTAAEVKEYAAKNGRGSVPGGMLVWADSILKPPKIRWQDKLRRSVRSAVAFRSGMQDYTYSRMSRRQPALNAFMARIGKRSPIVPAMHAPVINAAIGIDTSGSMGSDQLVRAASESQAVLRHIGTPCTFIACDAKVHGTIAKVANVKQLCARLHGGGGTDFVPLFEAVEKLHPRPDILIFITDGYGPAPAVAPKGVHTIFVLVGPYRRKPTSCETCEEITWGEFVEVNEDEQQ